MSFWKNGTFAAERVFALDCSVPPHCSADSCPSYLSRVRYAPSARSRSCTTVASSSGSSQVPPFTSGTMTMKIGIGDRRIRASSSARLAGGTADARDGSTWIGDLRSAAAIRSPGEGSLIDTE
jgi:hypothetical protein